MSTLLLTDTNGFLLSEHPANMHDEAVNWLSELDFCDTELSFLNKLLDKAFLRVVSKTKTDELSLLDKEVMQFRKGSLRELRDSVIVHEQHLATLDKDKFALNAKSVTEEHTTIRKSVLAFMESVRDIKRKIFILVEAEVRQAKGIVKNFEEGDLAL